ncbi:MAG: nucleotide exchange factor GrpE [Candidatus Campbellbacteria bacterium]|nr:nucleotide exchange factor GrpE [Candidatus Campbellbacteria bacterium]
MTHHKKDTPKPEIDTNEVTFEEVESEGASSFHAKDIKTLREELKACQKERQEYLEGWQRAKADLINFKKETDTNRRKVVSLATEDVITELIPVLDSFDMAFQNTEHWNSAPESWRRGVEYIYSQLLSILANHGVTQLSPLGEQFNPHVHDSLETVSVDSADQEGKIIAVTQKGYQLHEKLIRAPKVSVGHFE